MIPQQWSSPCGNQCTQKYAALTKIPWRVFCKKGCDADGDAWEECLEECTEICYKDPVFKDHQWSAYIDRSPGSASYSEECFHACASGCGFKFDVDSGTADKIQANRPVKPVPIVSKPAPRPPITEPVAKNEDLPSTSA
ncbi:uncharacterized protein LOC111782187 [Cucurbita pepo subsp. pepo]|uniref:Uncharacterized protein LOC111496877 n=2 Tax=Cucurbita TaxID=3660 RepID=A0A6J1KVS0_CUCMA|nr:uncharacterized protein LOC111433786 [Cucurbita moschata]XP_023003188.1 uncharacterized protein LOC111496877 [Cucurbita maxima]XP_023518775.1 uncharacterized protein LOC111782187 [Cucurbita pepo subsp. pepo]XP_023518776.1 uncharacterized protein LOC111782187 [Cucurbita pepo subsp. pepo]